MVYSGTDRFHSFSLGVGVPLFLRAQKAKISASKFQINVIQSQYQAELSTLQNQYSKLQNEYRLLNEVVVYYETIGLSNADLLVSTASKQFNNGELNYLEFSQLLSQAIAIKSNYLDAVNNLNEIIISIQYINQNN